MTEKTENLAARYQMEQCLYPSPSGGTLPYCRRLINPEQPGKTPVLLFLHGAGERGGDNDKQLLWCCPEVISWCERNHQKLLFLVPQCPPEQQWVNTPWQNLHHSLPEISVPMTLALEMLDMEIARTEADTDRLYISGISMGGYGTWDAISRFPEKFAAAFPICGGADTAQTPKLVKLPLRFYHGDADAAVPVSRSRDMADALRTAGSKVFTYTELPGCGHNAWTPAFSNDDNLAWLFAQKRVTEGGGKMKITVLGSCSGTEPMPGRHHTSVLLEAGEALYWFDAGESCAHTAHTSGFDLLRSRCLFITHPHMDHTGGLPHLVWTFAKLQWRNKRSMVYPFAIYTPYPPQVREYLSAGALTEFGPEMQKAAVHPVTDGVVYEDENISVEALHNRHLGDAPDGQWRSFSYRIQSRADGKKVLLSGDVKSPSDLQPFLEDGSDLLLMETGHHDPLEVCGFLNGLTMPPGKLLFYHHGRTILADPERCRTQCRQCYCNEVFLADDGMSISL